MISGKRVLSLFLALLLCVILFPAALAEEPVGSIDPAEDDFTEDESGGSIVPAEQGAIAAVSDEIQTVVGSGQCGDDLVWTLDEEGLITISGTGDMWDFPYFDSAPWYDSHSDITSVRILSGVTSIGNFAFDDCSNIVSVTIPEGVTSIGGCAFGSCESLTSVTLPESVTILQGGAFEYCYSLTDVTLSENVTIIGDGAFKNCHNLAHITLPRKLTYIGEEAFYYCSSITEVTVPQSVTSIGSSAFCYCYSLKTIRFTGPAPTFGKDIFYAIKSIVYYPEEDPSWTESVRQDYGGTITWYSHIITNGTLAIGSARVIAGQTFTVDLTLDKNPGIMALLCHLDFDEDALDFLGGEDAAFTNWLINEENNNLFWDSDWDQTETGCLLKLHFRVKEGAAPGKMSIRIMKLETGNSYEYRVFFQTQAGTVLICGPGDINGDGNVDTKDLVLLRQYLVGLEPEIIEENADVNADGIIDILDLVRMCKYLSMDDVILE